MHRDHWLHIKYEFEPMRLEPRDRHKSAITIWLPMRRRYVSANYCAHRQHVAQAIKILRYFSFNSHQITIMIIVFFHVLYLIGKMVYENYHSARVKNESANVEGQPSCLPAKNSQVRHGDIPDTAFDDDEPRPPRFSPPAYVQRYLAVQKVLADPRFKGKIKKVVDFGCSELGFLTHLKNTPGIEEILCIDVDRDTLERHKNKAIPLNVDYLQFRSNPLTIYVYEGSVTHRDKKLENCDAVVAIELIEHLYPETLMDFPHNIFAYIRPLIAAVTTPNADFNVLFPNIGHKFRHWDHKFEWTREQFEDWANNITSRYPEYEVSFIGIGSGPPGTEDLGCCSQMAVFTRTRESDCLAMYGIEGLLKSVTVQEFPHRIDNRSDEEKILDEAAYYIRQFTSDNSDCLEEYPLASLLRNLQKFFITETTLREILENGGYSVVDRLEGPAVMCPAGSTFSDYGAEMDNDDIEADDFDDDYVRSDHRGEAFTWETDNVEAAYDDNWDDDYEIPTIDRQINDESNVSYSLEVELSTSRSIDIEDLDEFEIPYTSPVRSASGSLEPERPAPFLETFDSRPDSSVNQNQNSLSESESQSVTGNYFDVSSSSINSPKSPEPLRLASNSEVAFGNGDTMELGSLCSMYLEASRNEEADECPVNITNPSFDCGALEVTFENSRKSTSPDSQVRERLSLPNTDVSAQPQFASSPRASLDRLEESQKASTAESADNLKSFSQTSLRSNGNSSSTTTSSGSSFTTIKKLYPPEVNPMYSSKDAPKLKGGNEFSDETIDEPTSESGERSPSDSFIDVEQRNLHVTRLQKQKAPESLDLRSTTNLRGSNVSTSNFTAPSAFSRNSSRVSDEFVASSDQLSSYVDSIVKTVEESLAVTARRSGSLSGSSKLTEASEIAEAKPASPDTPPNSWSPEIMDSGYPNSSSTQDMTPEYDLSSIAQDRISDSESPSVAEAPRLGFLEHADVENGDLANNNRDDEGNNMIAENDMDEDLQPLIDVLENDIENENDIYALENDFPVWLLRILERRNAVGRQAVAELRVPADALDVDVHAAGDAGLPDRDEGFDSTSSENDDSEADDDNGEEISTEGSEETIDWNASGDYC